MALRSPKKRPRLASGTRSEIHDCQTVPAMVIIRLDRTTVAKKRVRLTFIRSSRNGTSTKRTARPMPADQMSSFFREPTLRTR